MGARASTNRTAINELISQLLDMLPRGQYVGYTATPFANVFVDPSDAEDIFPRDFLISLERPPGYMGAQDFHDLDSTDPDRKSARSRTQRSGRTSGFCKATTTNAELLKALDLFVLTGAIKLFRQRPWRRGASGTTRCWCTRR